MHLRRGRLLEPVKEMVMVMAIGSEHRRTRPAMKASLSPARRRLVELMQQVNFGRIESVEVRNGEPVLDARVRLVRTLIIGKENRPYAKPVGPDFELKEKVVELFELLDREADLVIRELVIEDGLPIRMTVTDAPQT